MLWESWTALSGIGQLPIVSFPSQYPQCPFWWNPVSSSTYKRMWKSLWLFKERILKIKFKPNKFSDLNCRIHVPKSLTFVEHQYFPKLSCIFVHSLYTTSGSVTNVNGKIQFFCSFELFSFTKHCKMLVTFENRFRSMTKETMKNFMFK